MCISVQVCQCVCRTWWCCCLCHMSRDTPNYVDHACSLCRVRLEVVLAAVERSLVTVQVVRVLAWTFNSINHLFYVIRLFYVIYIINLIWKHSVVLVVGLMIKGLHIIIVQELVKRDRSLHAILHDRFWKSDHDFLIAFNSNFYLGCMVFEITRFYCKPDMTSSLFIHQGAPHAILIDGFWKGDPDFIFMFNWFFLSILNGLDVIRLFVFGWDFPTWGEMLGVFGQNDTQNVK